jgi:deoxyuridine 5'-triphosphate nucleotidohydrolase
MKFEYKKTLEGVPDLTMPKLEGDVGFDLSIVEKISTEEPSFQSLNSFGEHYDSDVSFLKETFDTGISVKPPKGYYFEVVPRSSISKTNYILANSIGIIDEDYRGSVKVCLYNLGKPTTKEDLPRRLFQLILRKNQARKITEIEEVKDFDATERGSRGFGSTG